MTAEAEQTHEPVLLSSADVAALARLTYRQLDFWTRCGYVKPVDAAAPGSGNYRVWPLVELAVACRMSVLVRLGVGARKAAGIARTGDWT